MKFLDTLYRTRDELLDRRSGHIHTMTTLASTAERSNSNLNAAQQTSFDRAKVSVESIDVDLDDINQRIAELEEVRARAAENAQRPALNNTPVQNPQSTYASRESNVPQHLRGVREVALRNIDGAFRSGQLPAHAAEKAVNLIDKAHPVERTNAMHWAAAAGNPHYLDAFVKLCADPERGHLLWTPEEADAYRRVQAMRSEERTLMSTTVGNGGYMIPLTLDPAIMLTNDGSNNPLRRLARVVQTTTNTWQGVTSAGAASEWKTEGSQAADGAPTVAGPSIPIFLADCFVGYSFEVGQDAVGFLDEVSRIMFDSVDQLQATAFTTGDGSSAPQGIVTGLAGTSSEINTTGSEAIVSTDATALQNALPARFSANASWQMNIATINTFRGFETTNGALRYPELRENPPSLLSKPLYENSNLDGSINAAATANNYVAIYGDVRAGFVIADRVGSTLELVPHLFGANGRPTGQRGLLLHARTGSEVVVPQALRLLDVPTTA